MSSIKTDRAREVAAALFEEVIVPLAKARQAAGEQAYFSFAGDMQQASYYEVPATSSLRPSDYELPGEGTADGLIDALASAWNAAGETSLASMAPGLKEIAELMQAEAVESDGTISILCYTMF